MRKKTSIIAFLILLFVLQLVSFTFLSESAHSQNTTVDEKRVTCGEIVEGEFIKDAEEHMYLLPMQPGESFEVAIEAVGDDLRTVVAIYGATGLRINISGDYDNNIWRYSKMVSQAPKVTSGTLSARGPYKIRVTNTAIYVRDHQDLLNDLLKVDPVWFGGVGIYTLSIGCTKADGFQIEPGDVPRPTSTPLPLLTSTPHSALSAGAPDFPGVGFPGLAPVDFSSVAKVPLLPDTVMTGVLPTGNEILGFVMEAAAGDTLDLSYTCVSGNMNLGLVVLSENNEVFFQASLVTSASLATQFTLPAAGQYTIGVFRISLVEPEVIEPTVFQLKVTTVD